MATHSANGSHVDGQGSRRLKLIQLIKKVVPNPQIPFPENCIPLHSEEGLQRLEGAVGNFEKIADCFEPQGPLQCAVTSLAVALNVCRPPTARKVSISELQEELRAGLRPPTRFFSVSLGEVGRLAERYAIAQTVYASDSDCNTFRVVAKQVLAAGGSVVANFKRSVLGYASPFAGHCSPLGAYSPDRDEFLVMDVAQRSFQPVWVPAELIFEGMNTIEKPRDEFGVGTLSRGYIILDPRRDAPQGRFLDMHETLARSRPLRPTQYIPSLVVV